MVDIKTYCSLHPESNYGRTPLLDEFGPEAMVRDEPPDEQFELLLPLKTKGYNLRRKKLFDLMADRISDVIWNKEAFQNLVIQRGTLILTSNRVGTFNEAFKSRIQLALHYPVLGPYQRLRIWGNFLNRLESFGDDDKVDVADLRDHLEDLKEEQMNGRQIRNAITTAWQYAEWKGKTPTYEHLSDVLEVSGRFDQY